MTKYSKKDHFRGNECMSGRIKSLRFLYMFEFRTNFIVSQYTRNTYNINETIFVDEAENSMKT